MTVQTTDDRLFVETEFAVPVEQVWAALTSPAAVAEWWGDHVRFAPQVGGELREQWTDASGQEIVTTGVVTRWDPPSSLEMTWADDDWPGETQVLFTLEERDGSRSILRLEHRGWQALPAERRRRLIDEHAAGWCRHLESLGSYLQR